MTPDQERQASDARAALAAAQRSLRGDYAARKAIDDYVWKHCTHNQGQGHEPWVICRACVLSYFRSLLNTSGKPGGEVVLGARRPLEPEEVVPAYSAAEAGERDVLKAQIEHMVNRFLAWKLPADFSPDAGISFKATFNENTPFPARHEPIGTNLFTATQAEAMVRHMVEGMPAGESGKPGIPLAEDALRVALEGVIGYAASRADELREYTVIAYRHAEAAVDRARAALRPAPAPAPPEWHPARIEKFPPTAGEREDGRGPWRWCGPAEGSWQGEVWHLFDGRCGSRCGDSIPGRIRERLDGETIKRCQKCKATLAPAPGDGEQRPCDCGRPPVKHLYDPRTCLAAHTTEPKP